MIYFKRSPMPYVCIYVLLIAPVHAWDIVTSTLKLKAHAEYKEKIILIHKTIKFVTNSSVN